MVDSRSRRPSGECPQRRARNKSYNKFMVPTESLIRGVTPGDVRSCDSLTMPNMDFGCLRVDEEQEVLSIKSG
jgi:hypothetical protein